MINHASTISNFVHMQEALATGKELLSLVNNTENDGEIETNGYVELDALSDSQHDDTTSIRDGGMYQML